MPQHSAGLVGHIKIDSDSLLSQSYGIKSVSNLTAVRSVN